MKKTNIRINNYFVFLYKNNYYLTDIKDLENFKDKTNNELKKYLDFDITDELLKLIKDNNIKSKVNFIIDNIDKVKNSKRNTKNIKISKKVGG